MQKTIGTLVPMSALGTFASGLVFLDWLHKTHQSAWQLLPLYQTQLEPGSATKHIPSPYKGYGIGLDPKYLPSLFANLNPTSLEKNDFIINNHEWIHDYALFCALRDHFKTDDWRDWDKDIRNREAKAIASWSNKLHTEIDNHIVIQWQLHTAYSQLRQKAKKLGITLIGDLSFYVALQSPLVWAYQDVFQIEKDGSMRYISGTLGGRSALFGRQVWGHPLYNWEEKNRHTDIASFWKIRLWYMAKLFDSIRFDYAKGFFRYGVIDAANKNNDTYKKGPGAKLLKELVEYNHQNNVTSFAEDCGRNLYNLRALLKKLHIPGVKIFRFALDIKKETVDAEYANIQNYPTNTVAYTTMHDTETLLGYLHILTPKQKHLLVDASRIHYENNNDTVLAKKLRDAVLHSPANTVIIPIQDWLLTTDRINVPGTELPIKDPNWQFKLKIPIEHLPTRF